MLYIFLLRFIAGMYSVNSGISSLVLAINSFLVVIILLRLSSFGCGIIINNSINNVNTFFINYHSYSY